MLPMPQASTTPADAVYPLAEWPSTASLRPLIEAVFPGQGLDFQVRSLPGDASDRRYYRLQLAPAVATPPSVVVMRLAKPHTEGELSFVNVQRYPAMKGLPVPEILWDDSTHGFLLLEDLGDITLETALPEAPGAQVAVWYRQALDLLLSLQDPESTSPRASCIAFHLAFDVEKLMWELEFF